jgi:hypothetical protein
MHVVALGEVRPEQTGGSMGWACEGRVRA